LGTKRVINDHPVSKANFFARAATGVAGIAICNPFRGYNIIPIDFTVHEEDCKSKQNNILLLHFKMARQNKLSLEEVLERVLDSDEEFSNSDFTDSEWSEEELDPCERETLLVPSKNIDNWKSEEVGHFAFLRTGLNIFLQHFSMIMKHMMFSSIIFYDSMF